MPKQLPSQPMPPPRPMTFAPRPVPYGQPLGRPMAPAPQVPRQPCNCGRK